jgi:metal-sulfur cluster biosynthetic enzyme
MFERLKAWFLAGASPQPLREGPYWDALRTVMDPELGMDIVSLGLVRSLEVERGLAAVRMTLSTRGCPVGPQIVEAVKAALGGAGVGAEVELEFDPPWSPDDMTPAAKAALMGR